MRHINRSPLSSVVLGFVSVCGFAVAGPALAGKGGHGLADFKTNDTDGDGKVSAIEHEASAKKMFNVMDTNQDGKVSADEMQTKHAYMTGKAMGKKMKEGDQASDDSAMEKRPAGHRMMSASEKIKVVDTNGDGVLTPEEHEAGARLMFEKMDSDKDGSLSKAEYEAGHAKLMNKAAK